MIQPSSESAGSPGPPTGAPRPDGAATRETPPLAATRSEGPDSKSPSPPPAAPPGRRSLRINLIYAVGGTGFQQVCRGLVVILLAKFASKDILGHYTNSLAVGAPLFMFTMLSLRTLHIADAHNTIPFGNFLVLRAITMLAMLAAFLPIIGWEYVQRPDWIITILLVATGLSRIVDGMGDICWGLFQKQERMDLVSLSNALRGFALLLPFAVATPLTWWLARTGRIAAEHLIWGLIASVAAQVALGFLVLWNYDLKLARRNPLYSPDYSYSTMRALAIQALPLGVMHLLVALAPNIPRYFVYDQKNGAAALGLFGALTWVIQAVNLVLIQAGHTSAHRLAVYFRENPGAFRNLTLKLASVAVAAGLPIFLICWLAPELTRFLLRVVFEKDYADHYAEFVIITGAQCVQFLASVLGFAVTQMQIYWGQVATWGSMCLVSLLCSWWLIPADPLRGAAYTVLATASVQAVWYIGWVLYGLYNREKLLARIRNREVRVSQPLA